VSVVEGHSNRRRFVKKLGLMVGAGLGVALIPAKAAWALSSYCCVDTSCDPCSSGTQYRCHDNCVGTTCCACSTTWAQPCQYQLPCTCSG
jgi:hypothetical protein